MVPYLAIPVKNLHQNSVMTTPPSVQEFYSEMVDTFGLRVLVEDALASVPTKFIAGIERVILRDVPSLTRTERRMRFKMASDSRSRELLRAKGLYYGTEGTEGARIELFPDNILSEYPSWVSRIPPLRTYLLTSVLFHEIGHHVQAAIDPKRSQEEGVADRWEKYLLRNFYRKRYRTIRLAARTFRIFTRNTANRNLREGQGLRRTER